MMLKPAVIGFIVLNFCIQQAINWGTVAWDWGEDGNWQEGGALFRGRWWAGCTPSLYNTSDCSGPPVVHPPLECDGLSTNNPFRTPDPPVAPGHAAKKESSHEIETLNADAVRCGALCMRACDGPCHRLNADEAKVLGAVSATATCGLQSWVFMLAMLAIGYSFVVFYCCVLGRLGSDGIRGPTFSYSSSPARAAGRKAAIS
eukprot:SAG22_NODE_956_length_6320_cov_2.476933_4_plen_202_part_00